MKESENLWNEDELLAQLEEMQDQIDSLLKEKDDLTREAKEKDKQLQDQEQMSSSERSKLQSALQQAQKKLQEQSDQIVKLSEADLTLKDNERLKEENARLQSEKEKSKKEAARMEEACEARIQRKDWLMQKKRQEVEAEKAAVKRKEEIANQLIRDRERLIRKEVDTRETAIRNEYYHRNQRALADAEEKWKAAKKSLIKWGASASLYSLTVTILLGYMSETYRMALKDAVRQVGNIVVISGAGLLDLVKTVAGISSRIPVQILKDIAFWTIVIVIMSICILAFLRILLSLIRTIKNNLTLAIVWPIILTLEGITTIMAIFGNSLQEICPINMIYAGMVLWIMSSICWYVFRRKKKVIMQGL